MIDCQELWIMFYATVIGLPVLYTEIAKKIKNKNLDKLAIIAFSILVSLRSGTGVDLDNYRVYFYHFTEGMTLNQECYSSGGFEFGYALINFILAKAGLPFGVLLFVVSVFNLAAVYRLLKELDVGNKVFAIFLYFIIFDIYVNLLQVIRQSIALSFYFFAVICLKRSKKIKAILYIVLGSFFHWTAIMVLPFLFLFEYNKKIKMSNVILISIVSPFAWYALFNTKAADMITGLFGRNISYRLNLYINYYNAGTDRWSSLRHTFVFMAITIAWILFLDSFKGMSDNGIIKFRAGNVLHKRMELDIADWSVIFFLITKEFMYIYYLAMLGRFQLYFFAFVPFVIARMTTRFKGRAKTLFVMILAIVFILRFLDSYVETNAAFGNAGFCLVNYENR